MINLKISRIYDLSLLYVHLKTSNLINQAITIDISAVSFLEPFHIITLVLFIIRFVSQGCNIKIILPTNPAVSSYLHDISFIDFCNLNYTQPTTIQQIARRTAMPIRRISPSTMVDYINRAKGYFSYLMPDKDLELFNIAISELINNVSEHSNSPIEAYVFSQLYPNKNLLKIVVADLGIGIPGSVNNYMNRKGYPIMTDQQALSWAVKENTSVKSNPRNRGNGLYNLMAFSDNGQSTLRIYSNDAFFTANNKAYTCESNPIAHFMGTIVELGIFTDRLYPLVLNVDIE
jgi:hypothetical protein